MNPGLNRKCKIKEMDFAKLVLNERVFWIIDL